MILVTGGTGFVGPAIVHALRAADRPVRVLVRDRARAGQLESLGCELAEGDMTDAASLRAAVKGCDTVVHLVAILVGKPADFERIMSRGTRDLVDAARDSGVRRWVQMSALGTSERSKDVVPYYGAKWDMEQTVKASGLPYVILRPSFVFGRGGGALKTFLGLGRLPVTPVAGAGKQRIQPIWIDDVAAYFNRAVDLDEATDRTFELGGPDILDWDELYGRIRTVLGKKRRTVHVPMALMRVSATLVEFLPGPKPITRDLLKMLETGDNVVSEPGAPETFGITPVPLDEQLRRAA